MSGAMGTPRMARRTRLATVRIQHGHRVEAQGTRMASVLAIAHGTPRATEDHPTGPRDGDPDSRNSDKVRLDGTAALAPEAEVAIARLRLPHPQRPARRLARMALGQAATRIAGTRIMVLRIMARDVVVVTVVDVRRIRSRAVHLQTAGMRLLLRRQARIACHGP